ncbi:type 1 glutamine amidotransferase [Candidatus Saccharibacteria bacterium]|nr:type 1 glutamine amidotransferase [Candidatus Saccharibacteria bacterium]
MGETQTLDGVRVALVATDGFEDSELTRPLEAVEAAGGDVLVISDKSGEIVGKNGTAVEVEALFDSVSPGDFHALLLPGGVQNPDALRMNEQAIEFIKTFFTDKKPVAAICHAPWLLAEADVLEGRTITSWRSIKTDVINAGAHWVDEPVVVDDLLVTSRKPDDLSDFCDSMVEVFGSQTQ